MVGIPLISPAALALVSLSHRRSSSEGLMVLAWAMLPVVVFAAAEWVSPLMTGLAASHLAAVFCGAVALRSSRSWVQALVVTTGVAAAGILLSAHFSGGLLQSLLAAAEESGGAQAEQLQQVFGSEPIATGYLSWVSAITAVLALVVGRWWQAMLDNPGGFRQEFHQLRLPLPLAAVGWVVWVYGLMTEDYAFWGAVIAFPLMVAGIALIHWLVARREWGNGPLVVMYIALVIVALPLAGLLCTLALIDSWIDIRGRVAKI
nr:hypothetical protein [Microbulbifer guangxiensis]